MPDHAPPPQGPIALGQFRAAWAAGTGGDWAQITKAALDQLGDVDGANLGFVYLTNGLATHAGSIATLLKQLTGIEAWVGATGHGIAATGVEVFERPAISVMVCRLAENGFHVVAGGDFSPAGAGLDDGSRSWLKRSLAGFGIVHGDPRGAEMHMQVHRLASDTGAYLVGGLASGAGELRLIAGTPSEAALSGVLFGAGVEPVAGLTQGCSPIGPVRTITGCDDNVITEIDDQPALDVFKQDIGELLSRDLARAAGYIFAALPVPGRDRTADYTVRPLVGIDPRRGWIAIGEAVDRGQTLLFVRRDNEGAIQDLDRMLADITGRLGGRTAKGAVYISCVARGPHVFGDPSGELRRIEQALGPVPLTGFFANGEICHDRIYGYTGVLTVFV